ncbi:hypothetical protein MTX26_25900 [Bradyrhizobium sp. ISRA443]|uniref:hypothetical protein n=1 Tax=unclassified Bradyrhizobium TaxID=2631580 RepID=UPI002479B391|nr:MULTISPECIES: hypothetical protein [unclassified Bradyrhizobium]WGR93267.1 hypothetical protein MTX20_36870 [Bradyrhizobium sp. ISRA435]WGR97793.1 hypothetical protein MTX23_25895 [Bradyrhizobium sp. ISRA436]WGS04682.1 hypothetical protein MTX18_25900 [Bradyrhizobium sp. ISRA437]WGS11563.1 hypothetical protein MTX26_25900 [Bradyrhizobium sp. ISRA443]
MNVRSSERSYREFTNAVAFQVSLSPGDVRPIQLIENTHTAAKVHFMPTLGDLCPSRSISDVMDGARTVVMTAVTTLSIRDRAMRYDGAGKMQTMNAFATPDAERQTLFALAATTELHRRVEIAGADVGPAAPLRPSSESTHRTEAEQFSDPSWMGAASLLSDAATTAMGILAVFASELDVEAVVARPGLLPSTLG